MHRSRNLLHVSETCQPTARDMGSRSTHAQIPRVDLKGFGHVARNTHELGKNERALLCALLCDDELHRRRVHTITEWSDDAKVCTAQECVELILLDGLVATSNEAVRVMTH